MQTESADVSRVHSVQDWLYELLSDRRIMIGLTVVPAFGLFLVINVLPIGWAIVASFYDINPFNPEWTFVGVDHYVEILNDPEFWEVLWNSIVFAGGSVIFHLVVGTGFALLINRKFSFAFFVRSIVLVPYLIPTAVIGFMGLWMANSQWGIINQVLQQLGLIDGYIAWYGNADLAMISVILTSSWKLTIFVTIMVLARLQSIPDDHYEAAMMAGASAYQRFRDITLPNLKGVIFIVILLRGIWTFNKFDIIWVLTQGGPVGKTTTAPIFAYETAFGRLNLGEASAVSVLLFALLVTVALLYFHVLEPSQEVRVE